MHDADEEKKDPNYKAVFLIGSHWFSIRWFLLNKLCIYTGVYVGIHTYGETEVLQKRQMH